jgi:hypothetical protein
VFWTARIRHELGLLATHFDCPEHDSAGDNEGRNSVHLTSRFVGSGSEIPSREEGNRSTRPSHRPVSAGSLAIRRRVLPEDFMGALNRQPDDIKVVIQKAESQSSR